ncbi:hypothetical protein [Acuticoccus sediminis]|nr:hypothetical protein [Acuticoccus sediminis]
MNAIARTAIAAIALTVTAIAANVTAPASAEPVKAATHATVPVPTPKPVL